MCRSSTSRTSPFSRFVSRPAKSSRLPIVIAFVVLALTPIAFDRMLASVAFPEPGGPTKRTWPSASPLSFAASTVSRSRAFSLPCPMNSSNVAGAACSPPGELGSSERVVSMVLMLPSFYSEGRVSQYKSSLGAETSGKDNVLSHQQSLPRLTFPSFRGERGNASRHRRKNVFKTHRISIPAKRHHVSKPPFAPRGLAP